MLAGDLSGPGIALTPCFWVALCAIANEHHCYVSIILRLVLYTAPNVFDYIFLVERADQIRSMGHRKDSWGTAVCSGVLSAPPNCRFCIRAMVLEQLILKSHRYSRPGHRGLARSD